VEDGLACYLPLAQQEAREAHYRETVIWAVLAPHKKDPGKQPEPPAILRF
jgi:hypothetical protein